MDARLRIGLPILVVAIGLGQYLPDIPDHGPLVVTGVIFSWSFVGVGTLVWHRRPENRTGPLMVLIGFMVYLDELYRFGSPLAWTAGSLFANLWVVPFTYLLFSFPRGRLDGKFDKAFTTIVAIHIVIWPPILLAFTNSADPSNGVPQGLNLLLVRDDEEVAGQLVRLSFFLSVALLLVGIVRLGVKWRSATVPGKRVLGPVVWTGLASLTLWLIAGGIPLFVSDAPYREAVAALGHRGMAAMPFGFLLGLRRSRSRRATVGDLLVQLGRFPTPHALQSALSATLGDPALEVGFWSPDSGGYVRPNGEPLSLPGSDDPKVVTYLEGHGAPLAAIVHDEALLDDPSLVSGVAGAARLAVDNDRLQREVEEHLREVRESRARIVQAADEERRRVERNLHDGAQQRLVSLSLALRSTQAMLDGQADPAVKLLLEAAANELEETIREIRELARGIHPSILTDQGLMAAVEALAERSRLPLEIGGLPEERLEPAVEATAYFVIAEALANVAKHGSASAVTVRAALAGGHLELQIADDGVGGARVTEGGGLRGLADRVEALGGDLRLESSAGRGTKVIARIPDQLHTGSP